MSIPPLNTIIYFKNQKHNNKPLFFCAEVCFLCVVLLVLGGVWVVLVLYVFCLEFLAFLVLFLGLFLLLFWCCYGCDGVDCLLFWWLFFCCLGYGGYLVVLVVFGVCIWFFMVCFLLFCFVVVFVFWFVCGLFLWWVLWGVFVGVVCGVGLFGDFV